MFGPVQCTANSSSLFTIFQNSIVNVLLSKRIIFLNHFYNTRCQYRLGSGFLHAIPFRFRVIDRFADQSPPVMVLPAYLAHAQPFHEIGFAYLLVVSPTKTVLDRWFGVRLSALPARPISGVSFLLAFTHLLPSYWNAEPGYSDYALSLTLRARFPLDYSPASLPLPFMRFGVCHVELCPHRRTL